DDPASDHGGGEDAGLAGALRRHAAAGQAVAAPGRAQCRGAERLARDEPPGHRGAAPGRYRLSRGSRMPIGGQDWLALTAEPTLEPDLPICDAHPHLWEFRPEPAHYQRYLLSELAEDLTGGHNVRATVFIEVRARYRTDGPEEMRPVGEVEFVEGLATES